MGGEAPEDVKAAPVSENKEVETTAVPSFDLTKKKKKKKPKATAGNVEGVTNGVGNIALEDGANLNPDVPSAAPVDEPLDFALPDFSGKKKTKKKVFFDADADAESGKARETAEGVSRRDVQPQPWDGTDRDYTYAELIGRALQFLHGKNPALASGGPVSKKVSLPLPQVAREGTKKTVFLNFGSICKSIHRQQEHLLNYIGAELGTTSNIQDGGRLVIKGRFGAEGILNVLKKYMLEYVICTSCRSPDTVLMRDANTRLYFVSCESCGAKRSVAPIRQGFMAQVEKRKRR
ncbi:Eukaryotic translation initiation factor 2 subunit beta [Gracilariopsis chorda]|uniref:Eukaryotic translation initiation factor 2 subunit beta n=1 Tax=Gracilariopsis chorda TaxID=448386 RepID=A0A2V3J1R9_9FLOR|nr:Eukaryotic translation initiation factor 2 subunit beta [Gracilariopsis chorda]|eukprot:PXF47917.1 Eukaryotic translation initiation factor 2 subunit beta [Gracilariopsis chorda]